ncbi:MAG TPA: thioredoxin [Candidatus Ruthenibacterium merdigallinarum]|nr:thioredoxin [Candidatus Ruthenibacterium merdigallinarum]
MEKELTAQNFAQNVEQAKGAVLVDFWAPWCGPCRMLAPTIRQIADERTDVTVCKLNVDEAQDVAARYGVMSIPTVVLFRDGKEAARSVGLLPKDRLLAALGL